MAILRNVGYTPSFDENNYLDGTAGGFETGSTNLMTELEKAQQALQQDPSNPSTLATYQSKLSAYTLFRSAQTAVVKAYKDVGSNIIQNFR
ncbi:type III secretion system needle filament subunit SctF [Erwinia tracheiphila]|uniref:EscF/YscF/HrpA family type III secretion system needle major subunit n=1 Tax=Erwinia tracheiphila TaxID=65700 RepID=A0A0M2KBJ5_9GAMM|nr:type III secretion system needle filament subunit SctF [Erwinia tracheiphila]AXF77648.1 EscF/YscF/HrpA family type III secretion system needle major subunit [Erwinia tracheiphila]EOS94425.1 type III secretion system protein [Erwinia tracheiphila PSU-1]KKF36730.1 type III secretion system needle complex protein PrgI [Erwinia tracheiphila]UIA83665.1 type III secretion system needle filament subunit SctF [Erwinia tracheiphila]UIA88065.1 type III secretion system needle filament subunit SctF [E